MKNIFFGLVFLSGFFLSCHQDSKSSTAIDKQSQYPDSLIGKPIVAEEKIVKDFNSFWSYYNQYGLLYQNFVAFDESGKEITKPAFLDSLKTRKYFQLVVNGRDERPNFKLVKIPKGLDTNIGSYLRQDSEIESKFYEMKGKPIPEFSFKDLNGKLYTSANTKGKIVLFKCWFIGCTACINEMPALNKLVEKYKNRTDILFISLASDEPKALSSFLSKTKFDYVTVANQEDFMLNQLNVRAFPTHFLIDKQGKLREVVNEEHIIERLLAKLAD